MSLTQERYGSLLGRALESTRRYLFETHFNFQEGKILHPKLSKLLNIVAQWSKEQDASDERAAIIAFMFPEKLKNELRETLSGLHGIQVKQYKSATDLNEFQAEGMLAVYLISALDISEDFPWDSFDFVLDYDPTTSTEREKLSHSSRLKDYVRLRAVAKALLDEQSVLESQGTYKDTSLLFLRKLSYLINLADASKLFFGVVVSLIFKHFHYYSEKKEPKFMLKIP